MIKSGQIWANAMNPIKLLLFGVFMHVCFGPWNSEINSAKFLEISWQYILETQQFFAQLAVKRRIWVDFWI